MAVATDTYVIDEVFERPPLQSRLWSILRSQPLGIAGALIVFVMIVAALFAPYISPYDPELNDFGAMLLPPDAGHWLGTDEFGRDIFSRLVWGSRTAMLVGFSCALVGSTAGLLIGVASAYFGGKLDILLQRVIDIFIAFPAIILALAIVTVLGPGTENVIIAITIPLIPNCARVVRSSALAIREIPYVDAARALGFGHARIVLRHMSPNVMAPYLIHADHVPRAGNPRRGDPLLPRARGAGADPGLGPHAPGRRPGVRGERALGADLPRRRDQPRRLRFQPLRRRPPAISSTRSSASSSYCCKNLLPQLLPLSVRLTHPSTAKEIRVVIALRARPRCHGYPNGRA